MPQPYDRSRRWARTLLIVAAAMFGWALAVSLTGGFRIELGPVRLSSRNAVRITLLALVPAAIAWRLAYRDWLEVRLQQWRPVLCKLALPLVVLLGGAFLIIGVVYGARTAAASDPSGYVSQSALWIEGSLRIDQSWAGGFAWPHAKQTFAPLGYRIGRDEAMVPTYAPGAPLLMATGRLFSPCGPYLVGPLCGALVVLFTFLLGRKLAGTATSVVAAALVACSPLVLFMALSPTADVPATAFWTGALALALQGTLAGSVASGVLAGIAILIRPNLVPLALFPWLLLVIRQGDPRAVLARTVLFAAGSVPAALFIAWLNSYLYGSPLVSGYGELGPLFSLEFAWTNVRQYSAWWWESQGPLAFLVMGAPFRRGAPLHRERLVLFAFAASVGLLYLFYQPFSAWWFLRFLLPAVPIVFLFCADVVNWAGRGSLAVRIAGLAAFLLIAGGYAVRFNDVHDITNIGMGEQRYIEPALYVAETTPEDAVIITMQHSGSMRYHAGRLTLRWDWLEPEWLDTAIAALADRGLPTYLLLEQWEAPEFRQRFRGQRLLAVLDSPPIAVGRDGELRLYAVNPRQSNVSTPASIPRRTDRTCLDISPDYVEPPAVRTIRQKEGNR